MIPIAVDWLTFGKWAAVIAIAIGLWSHGFAKGNDSGEIQVAELKTEHAQVMLNIASETKRVAELTRKAEHALGDELAKIDTQHEEALRHASQNARNAVLADLRSDRVGLRIKPTHCSVPATVASAGTTGISDGTTNDGSGDAINLAIAETVGIAARADERLTACQAVINSYTAASAAGAGKP